MERGFDLQPVLSLLDTLSPSDYSHGSPSIRQWSSSTERRRLGDFTAIFQYLGDSSRLDSQTPQPSFSASLPPWTTGESGTTSSFSRTEQPPKQASTPRVEKVGEFTSLPHQPLVKGEVEVGGHIFKWVDQPVICSDVAPHVQKAIIIHKLLVLFPEEIGSLLSPRIQPSLTPAPADPGVHIFIDSSNILIGFLNVIKATNGYGKFARIRPPTFSFPNLCLILERGRAITRKVLVGSTPITPAITDARALGYECSLLEKIVKEKPSPKRKKSSGSSSGSDSSSQRIMKRKGEQAVDEVLNMKMLESLLDFAPSTLVLGSGDGALGEFSAGFFKTVERALHRGWSVELASFMSNTNKAYLNKSFRTQWGDNFTIISLDNFAEQLLG